MHKTRKSHKNNISR